MGQDLPLHVTAVRIVGHTIGCSTGRRIDRGEVQVGILMEPCRTGWLRKEFRTRDLSEHSGMPRCYQLTDSDCRP